MWYVYWVEKEDFGIVFVFGWEFFGFIVIIIVWEVELLELEKGEVGCFGSIWGKMVGLNLVKFYGRFFFCLCIYCDIKFSDVWVDFLEFVNVVLLEWVSEVSWRMGGIVVKCKCMSGKIEGCMNKLCDMEESDDDEFLLLKKVWDK